MSKPQDIFIFIEGYAKKADEGKNRTSELAGPIGQRFNTLAYLKSHQPIQWINYIGGSKNDPTSKIVDSVMQTVGVSNPVGDVFITGGSAGGTNVLSVALQLNERQIPIRYIGIWDAAFDRADRKLDSIPSKVQAKEKRNWYQTYSEKLDTELRQEVHAPIDGFENMNLDNSTAIRALQASSALPGSLLGIGGLLIPIPGKLRQTLWNLSHDHAYNVGKEESLKDVRRIVSQP